MGYIHFNATADQLMSGAKTVTRRLNWKGLRPGERLSAVRSDHRGGRRRLATIEVLDVRRERLDAITADDVVKEGFPEMSVEDFVAFFCRSFRCAPDAIVTRIEFRRL